MTQLEILLSPLVFYSIVLSVGWPVAARLPLSSAEKLCASVVLSLLGTFAVAWSRYVFAIPAAWLWALPAIAIGSVIICRKTLIQNWGNPISSTLLVSQLLVSAWCVGWLALVRNYSGGRLVGDWFGHWQRALFFLYRWPRDLLFNGFDPLPSRPPLANVITGALLRITQIDFAHYQLFSTLLGSIAFLPAAMITRRFYLQTRPNDQAGSCQAVSILAVFFMLSPLFVENATFAWTKLPTAFFVLSAIYFFLRAGDVDSTPSYAILCAISGAAGLITHYSAAPYFILLMVGWVFLRRAEIAPNHYRSETIGAVFAGTFVAGMWFGWAWHEYGSATFLSNTSITDRAHTVQAQLVVILFNLRDTVVPHFLHGASLDSYRQSSPWGWWRDWFFQLYQCNLLFAFGSAGWAAILITAGRDWKKFTSKRIAWLGFVVIIIILGVAVHGGRETGGLANICLQPLILVGLSYLAARWSQLSGIWRLIVVAGATADFVLGIALQFGVENGIFDRWLSVGSTNENIQESYSLYSILNFRVKADAGWIFFGDLWSGISMLVVLGLGAVLALSVFRTTQKRGR